MWWRDLNNTCVGPAAGNWFEGCLCRRIGEGDETLFWVEDWHGRGKFRDVFADLFSVSSQQNFTVSQMGRWVDGKWLWSFRWKERLSSALEGQLNSLLSIVTCFKPTLGVKDSWKWIKEGRGNYSVSSAYESIFAGAITTDKPTFKLLWKVAAPSNALALGWKLILNRIQTKDNLSRRNIQIADSSCALCLAVEESAAHLFFSCRFAWEVWSCILKWLGMTSVLPASPEDHFLQFCWDLSPKIRAGLSTIWLAVVWETWNGRNAKIFNEKECTSAEIFDQARMKALAEGQK
ncbi:uncharacterized protein LOC130719735 [Lotus japonicus]|uniref:uncharacterized protein LOC130719735 n=1 Tax=Lotus japonicus TaxID=34305 RepID=UPI00258702EF|nr:uncharacterized protein LOC130719735 [Lotus japonicus]